MDNDQDWVRVATHGDSADDIRARLVDALDDALVTLGHDLVDDPDIPIELIGAVLAKVRAYYLKRIDKDVAAMLRDMALTASAGDDAAPVH